MMKQSPIYRSAPVGFVGDFFLNCVVEFEFPDDLPSLQKLLATIEAKYRGPQKVPTYQSRTIDLDLLLFGDWVEITEDYELPRSDILKFAFVLKPLVDLAPSLMHPQLQRSMLELWDCSTLKHFPLERTESLAVNCS